MKYENIQNKLNELWSSRITGMDFNILSNSIRIFLEILDAGVKSEHILEFQDVSAFFFVNNTGSERKKFVLPEIDDYLELTSINLIEGDSDIKTESPEKWIEQYYSKANVAIEIWSRVLFVESKQVKIDAEVYELTA